MMDYLWFTLIILGIVIGIGLVNLGITYDVYDRPDDYDWHRNARRNARIFFGVGIAVVLFWPLALLAAAIALVGFLPYMLVRGLNDAYKAWFRKEPA